MTPFDPGLQLERTAIAWQRTALSLVAASLAVGRMLQTVVGPLSWAGAALGVGIGVAALVLSRRRYASAHEHLVDRDPRSLPHDGSLLFVTALLCVILGGAALLLLVERLL